MKVLLEGPLLTRSGYGEHTRLVYRSLKSIGNVDIYSRCVDWGKTSWISDYSDDIHETIIKNAQYTKEANSNKKPPQYDVQVFVGILNEFEKKAPYSVVVTAGIETDRVSPEWLLKSGQGVDKIIVPSEHSRSGFTKTSYSVTNETTGKTGKLECGAPVEVVPYPIKNYEAVDVDLDVSTDFNFLNIALLGPRKNLENSVEWFLEEFKDEPNVGLILKTARSRSSLLDREATKQHLQNIMIRHKDSKCKVYLLHGHLTEQEIHSLYTHPKVSALVSATCGEGYGLPIFEAAYSGLPVVATDWSAHLDFLTGEIKENGKMKTKKLFAKVDYTLAKIPDQVAWKSVLTEDSMWAYVNPSSFKSQMRKMYKNHGMYKKWAVALQSQILESHSEESVYNQMADTILSDKLRSDANRITRNDEMDIITI